MQFPTHLKSRSFLVFVLACFFLTSGCQNNQRIEQLQQENAQLRAEIEQLKAQQQNPTVETTVSPTPIATEPPVQETFDDIKGVFGEKEITQLAQLGVFDTTTGDFNPQQPITRAEFLRWLMRANNAIWFDQPDKMIREAQGAEASFTDVPPTHPDFRYIQGFANAGIAVGYDEKTFNPNQPLTREQMIAIKIGVDKGGIETAILDRKKAEAAGHDDVSSDKLANGVPDWSDRNQISPRFIPAFNSEYYTFWGSDHQYSSKDNKFKNVERTFGAIKALKPQDPVTRSEAALCISSIGNHTTDKEKIESRTAEEAFELKTNPGKLNPAP